MPIKLSDLKKKTKRVSLEILGETLAVEYRPGAITPVFLSALQDETLAAALPQIITWWDLQDEDGEMIPIDEDSLKNDGFIELNKTILGALLEDIANPTKPKAPTSSFG